MFSIIISIDEEVDRAVSEVKRENEERVKQIRDDPAVLDENYNRVLGYACSNCNEYLMENSIPPLSLAHNYGTTIFCDTT